MKELKQQNTTFENLFVFVDVKECKRSYQSLLKIRTLQESFIINTMKLYALAAFSIKKQKKEIVNLSYQLCWFGWQNIQASYTLPLGVTEGRSLC